ncbi:hypothetical protein WJX74_007770 [Apatococcus lobatus]|uniref:Uncharacterized protein n=1 Tax=Apatococcus lobatus TaxID=904363 RepID=A0AAW1RLM3_9CHLO
MGMVFCFDSKQVPRHLSNYSTYRWSTSIRSLLRIVRGKGSRDQYLTSASTVAPKPAAQPAAPYGKAAHAAVLPSETDIQATATQPVQRTRAIGFARAACGRFEAHWEVLMVDFPVWGSGLTLSEAEKDAVDQLQQYWARDGRGPTLPAPSTGETSRKMTLHKVALLQQERPNERLPAFSEYTMYIGRLAVYPC